MATLERQKPEDVDEILQQEEVPLPDSTTAEEEEEHEPLEQQQQQQLIAKQAVRPEEHYVGPPRLIKYMDKGVECDYHLLATVNGTQELDALRLQVGFFLAKCSFNSH